MRRVRSAVKKEVRTPKYRQRIVPSKKGKGSYKRERLGNVK